jgi:hypothetical protein
MRFYRPGLSTLAYLIFPLLVAGQQSTPQPAQASSILQGSLKALLGTASITDVTISATARRIAGSDDETGTATLTATAAGDSELNLNFPSGPRTEVRNHSALPLPDSFPQGVTLPVGMTAQPQPVGAWSGTDGVSHGMVGHNLMTDATWFVPAFTIGTILSSANYVIPYAGQEVHNGQQALHVSVTKQFLLNTSGKAPVQVPPLVRHLSQMDLYLDPTTLLPLELDLAVHPDNNAKIDIPVEIYFSDYRSVGGAQVPFHVQRYLNNSLSLDLTFNNVTFNTGLSPASFAIQ